MRTQILNESDSKETRPRGSLATQLAFRFCFVYLGTFCLTTQIVPTLFSPSQGSVIPDPATLWPIRQIVFWTAEHIFRVAAPLSFGNNSASGDDTFGWMLAFCLLIFAAFTTAIWSLIDQESENYERLHRWFRLFIRLCLAGQMLNYGLAKVIPTQMPYPDLTTLIRPFGNFSPMGILWSSIGAAPAYEVFAGCAETVGGLLLIFPRTTTFGALICLADMVEVFILNMTYDVPVKLFSFHLILLALFLLTADVRRLINVFLLNGATEPAVQDRLFRTHRANRITLAAQILFGLWLFGMNCHFYREAWYIYGGGRPISPLYGIWEVNQMSMDEQLRPRLLGDADRWRRVIFDYPTMVTFQRIDGSFVNYGAAIDVNHKTIALTRAHNKNWKANLAFQRVSQDGLTLDGTIDGHVVHMQLQIINLDKFSLVSRRFHWIRE
jgi:uncharacterized membrane protein YphA (DoxX/SURF4 family)